MIPIVHIPLIHEEELVRQEEEKMTRYTSEELQQGFEFKIVRAADGRFRHPQRLQQLVDEESAAGWQMLEKLDDNRVRFKRSHSARRRDDLLPSDVDPYRTQVGSGLTSARQRYVVLGISLSLLLMVGLITFFIITNSVF